MRFISFTKNNETYAGLELVGEGVIQLTKIDKSIPNSINEIIKNYSQFEETIQKVNDKSKIHYSIDEVEVLSPIPDHGRW